MPGVGFPSGAGTNTIPDLILDFVPPRQRRALLGVPFPPPVEYRSLNNLRYHCLGFLLVDVGRHCIPKPYFH